ncbi:hypothetical protein [Streptomyces sp. NRRL S-378]|uniref:hypothetical protein n=1 Tax=Streptomyces sp. NRRL S-378 TaxID=1463904 RepID=UPI0004C94E33|nr:hypothetical protein [Streptomyces sp. NRRL S-378]
MGEDELLHDLADHEQHAFAAVLGGQQRDEDVVGQRKHLARARAGASGDPRADQGVGIADHAAAFRRRRGPGLPRSQAYR